jgi:5-amino-6-(5-phosphoribosylamino)uracil reductase
LLNKLAPHATIVNAGEKIDLQFVLHDLYERGVKRLLVEGGSSILTQFLQQGFVSELHLAISGFFVGEESAPRFVQKGEYMFNAKNRMHLASVEKIDDIAVLVYKI